MKILKNISFFKLIKIFIVIGASIIILTFLNFIVKKIYYTHEVSWFTYKKYKSIFKESAIKDVSKLGISYVYKQDVINNFRFDGEMFVDSFGQEVILWDFKELKKKKINSISINLNKNLENVFFDEYETLFAKSTFFIDIKNGFSFEDGFNLNFPKSDSTIFQYNGKNYKGVFGKFSNFTISNGNGEYQIDFVNNNSCPLLSVIVFEKNDNVYLLVVNSDFVFDKSIIDIFNI